MAKVVERNFLGDRGQFDTIREYAEMRRLSESLYGPLLKRQPSVD